MTTNTDWVRACGSGTCLEVRATIGGQHVILRTTGRVEETIVSTGDEWRAFVTAVKNGDFDQVLA